MIHREVVYAVSARPRSPFRHMLCARAIASAAIRTAIVLTMCAAAGLVSTSAIAQAPPPDLVLLKDGGRVRGTVIEQDSKVGVRIQLSDGTIKNIPNAKIQSVEYGSTQPPAAAPEATPPAPAPPPPTKEPAGDPDLGSVNIESSEPGTAFVDGGQVGETPRVVSGLRPGRHRIKVEFASGGDETTRVLVEPGRTTDIKVTPSEARRLSRFRAGVHLALSGEPSIGFGAFGVAGVKVDAGIQIGVAPAVDLRVLAVTGINDAFDTKLNGGAVAVPFAGRAAVRFNAGSVYSMEVGFQGGAVLIGGNTKLNPYSFVEPMLSLASFRFGDKRQFEVGELTGFQMFLGAGDYNSSFFNIDQSLVFTFLLLPSGP